MNGMLSDHTAVMGSDGRYTATLTREWEAGFGPFGGYVAAVCMRAAGAESPHPRLATFACQYLNPGKYESVGVTVDILRQSKRTASLRVLMTQEDRPIATALVWTVADDLQGLQHEMNYPMPEVPPVEDTIGNAEIIEMEGWEPRPMDRQIEWRAPDWVRPMHHKKRDPILREWLRFLRTPTFEDPFVDAGRVLIAIDLLVMGAPAQYHDATFPELPYVGASLDLTAHFHQDTRDSEWLLHRACGPVAADGLIGTQASVWSQAGKLVATGTGHLLCRPNPFGDGLREDTGE